MIHKLFLSHYSGDAAEVADLATELRLRGLVPWVDNDGGFSVGDDAPLEARRAIRDDCFGFLLYATRRVFGRSFIRDIEVREAIATRMQDPSYVLMVVPRNIGFKELSERSKSEWGIDLTQFHSVPIRKGKFESDSMLVSVGVLRKYFDLARPIDPSRLGIQFSTRPTLPDEPDNLLRIDATLVSSQLDNQRAWTRVLTGLQDVKQTITSSVGRASIRVDGSKHLTSAFMFGRVFSYFELNIRQTAAEWWGTDLSCDIFQQPFAVEMTKYSSASEKLIVEIATANKSIHVSNGVDRFISQVGLTPAARLRLSPATMTMEVNDAVCRAMAEQAYRTIEGAIGEAGASEVHLFVAGHQAFMMMLGWLFQGMPPTHHYEWVENKYLHVCTIPGGVL